MSRLLSHAVDAFCLILQYLVKNSALSDMLTSALAISSRMKLTDTLTPRFGRLLRNSFMSFHLLRSSIWYKKGSRRVSRLLPSRNCVDRLYKSSYMPSLT